MKRAILKWILILILPIWLFGIENYTYIETPKISLEVDEEAEDAIEVVDTIHQNTKLIYASSHTHKAFDDTVFIKWYYYKNGKATLIKKETLKADGYQFVFSVLEPKNGSFAKGDYKVTFQVGLSKIKSAKFKVVDNNQVIEDKNLYKYDVSNFLAFDEQKQKSVKIQSLTLKKLSWSENSNRLSLKVTTKNRTYKDDYIYCTPKKQYYNCPAEGDAGYLRVDDNFNIQINLTFTKETLQGVIGELSIKQKDESKWIKPIKENSKAISTKKPNKISKDDAKLIEQVLKNYPLLSSDDIEALKLNRYYDKKYKISIIAPNAWKELDKSKGDILFLEKEDSNRLFKFILSVPSDLKYDGKKPIKEFLKSSANLIEEVSVESAKESQDKIELSTVKKLAKYKNYYFAHFTLKREGKKSRWESYTLIWDDKNLYLLGIMSKIKDSILVEFLSSLIATSFRSEL